MSEVRRVAESAHRPEIVPVGVHGMGEVALVARRFGQQAMRRATLRRAELRAESLVAQLLQVARRGEYGRPQLGYELEVAREAPVLGHDERELAVTVVLGQPVGAVAV